MYDISVYLPSIRPHNIERLYDSIMESVGHYTFQLVLCGPYGLDRRLDRYNNIKTIRDFGSPVRCAEIAVENCEGRLITLGADDGVYLKNKLCEAITYFYSKKHKYLILALKYGEGGDKNDGAHWLASSHGLPFPANRYMFLNSIMERTVHKEVGGYDCVLFETCNWGGFDLYERLIRHGCDVELYKDHVLVCDWMEGTSGDHAPIHHADCPGGPGQKMLYHLYARQDQLRGIGIGSSWRDAPKTWSRRFS